MAQFKVEKLNRFGRNIMKMIVKKDYQNGILLPGRRPGNNASNQINLTLKVLRYFQKNSVKIPKTEISG